MYKRVTDKLILEGAKIAYTKGYNSNELLLFLDEFGGNARNKINEILAGIYRSCSPESSCHYKLIKDAGLLEGEKNKSTISSKRQQKADELYIMKEAKRVDKLLKKCTRESFIDAMIK